MRRWDVEIRIALAVAAFEQSEEPNRWTVYFLVRAEMEARRITLARAAELLVELGFALSQAVVRSRMRDTAASAPDARAALMEGRQ